MHNSQRGVSLIEVLISAFILATIAIVFLQGYISCIKLASLSKEYLYVLNSAQDKMEEIRNYNFSGIYNYYNNGVGHTFKIGGFDPNDNMGVVSVDNSNPDLLYVIVTVCWRHLDGRIIGEDTNLDGILQSSEDTNNNAKIDSPITLVTYVNKP